jgi:hypothetical protein
MPRVFKFDLAAKRLSEEVLTREDGFVVWSSAPYPMDTIDRADLGVALAAADFRTIIKSTELLPDATDMGVALTAGQLRNVSQVMGFEDRADMGVALTGSLLQLVLKAQDQLADRADMGIALTGSEFRVALTVQTQLPDMADLGVSLTTGYLGP